MNPETEQKNPHPLLIPFSIIVAGALVGGGIYLSAKNPVKVSNSNGNIPVVGEINMKPVSEDDHILGNPNAQVIIVEYSDLECPFCKTFHQTMKRIMNDYGKDGKVAWVYRHFPIASLHSKATNESEASECVASLGGNEKFWQYIDSIFATTNSNDSLDPAELPKLAVSLGINEKKFNDCLSGGKFSAKITDSIKEAIQTGAKGTPNSILITRDGRKVVIQGAQSYQDIKAVIDVALNQQ